MTKAGISFRTGSYISARQLEELYRSVGWQAYTSEDQLPLLEKAFRSSDYVISAWLDDQLIGVARCLSDNVSILYLQDILVHPAHQQQGLGSKLLNACLERYAHVRSKVLLTGGEKHILRFYESFGFKNTRDLRSVQLNAFVKIRGLEIQ